MCIRDRAREEAPARAARRLSCPDPDARPLLPPGPARILPAVRTGRALPPLGASPRALPGVRTRVPARAGLDDRLDVPLRDRDGARGGRNLAGALLRDLVEPRRRDRGRAGAALRLRGLVLPALDVAVGRGRVRDRRAERGVVGAPALSRCPSSPRSRRSPA